MVGGVAEGAVGTNPNFSYCILRIADVDHALATLSLHSYLPPSPSAPSSPDTPDGQDCKSRGAEAYDGGSLHAEPHVWGTSGGELKFVPWMQK